MPRAKKMQAAPNEVLVTSTGEFDTPEDAAPEPVAAPMEPKMNAEKIKALGTALAKDFEDYARDRLKAEQQWAKNLRQFLGEYDPKIKAMIAEGRSLAYPKLTRVKCISMLSRLMNLLFPSSEKNWTIAASPVPNLDPADLQQILDKMTAEGGELTDEKITDEVMEFATMRAKNLETEIADQLTELGGSTQLSYVAVARKVLMSGIMYGMGVMKGPFLRTRVQTRWKMGEADPETGQQKIVAVQEEIRVPQFDFCPIWDYYPDMSAKYLHQMDGQFMRVVMSRQQVRALADDPLFIKKEVLRWLKENQTGNYKERQFETEIRQLGLTEPAAKPKEGRKYEVIVWDGMRSGHELADCGVHIPEDKLADMIECTVWCIENTVIRCSLNPWRILEEPEHVATYHHFMFEEDDSTLVGNGLPQIMRDSQLGVCAAVRMILDNAGIVCGPSVEINTALLVDRVDHKNLRAYQVFERDDDESSATANIPAVRPIKYESYIPELEQIVSLFRGFADQETFVNPATGGDMQQGPSEPFRTAAGASMLTGLMALPFKDAVRNFDVFTESFMKAMVLFNKHFNNKESIRGDFQAVARGATSLIAKEVRGIAIDELAKSLTPQEQLYVEWPQMLKERLNSRDVPLNVMCDDAEVKRRDAAQAEKQQRDDERMSNLIHAETRKALADAVKALTQSDKNTTAAQAVIYTALAKGIENGISPQIVADTRAGAPVPPSVVRQPAGANNAGGGKAGKPAAAGGSQQAA